MINLNSFNLDGTYKADGIKFFNGVVKENKRLSEGDLLIAITDVTRNADIIGKAVLVPNYVEGGIYSMDVAKITPVSSFLKSYLLMLFNSEHYHNYIKWYASGTLVLHLKIDGMHWYKAEVPPVALQKKFDLLYQNLRKRIENSTIENNQLENFRDWLLPMLMNGQVTIKD